MPGNFYYNPGQSYNTAVYTARGFDALAQGIQEFAQQQRLKKAEEDAQAYEDQKNETILNSIRGLTDSQGKPYMDPTQLADILGTTNGKARSAKIAGALASVHYGMMVDKERPATPKLTVLQPPMGAPTGMKPQVVLTAGQHSPQNVTPETPMDPNAEGMTGMIQPTPQNGLKAPVPYFHINNGQISVAKPVPANANKDMQMPNGQWAHFDENGGFHPLALNDGEFKSLEKARSDAEQAILGKAAPRGLNLNDVGDIAKNPDSVSYLAATDKFMNKDGTTTDITRPYKKPDGSIEQIKVAPGEHLSSEDAGAIAQTYGADKVRADGVTPGGKGFNMPFSDYLDIKGRFDSLPPKPVMRGASSAPVKVISPDGKSGTIPASQVEAALAAGYKTIP